jgi:hypothetical protein
MSAQIRITGNLPLIGSIVLSRWRDPERETFKTRQWSDMSLELSFDRSCLEPYYFWHQESLERFRNVEIEKLYFELSVKDISDRLSSMIRQTNAIDAHDEDPETASEYHALGEIVYERLFSSVNRLIAWIRAEKGQYWVHQFRLDPQKQFNDTPNGYSPATDVQTYINDEPVFWCPPANPTIVTAMDNGRALHENDVCSAWQFLCTDRRPDLVLELLCDAELLEDDGHDAIAITQAITALEVATDRFSKSLRANALYSEPLRSRLEFAALKSAVRHLGFNATYNYLVPLLFSEEQLPTEILKQCQRAIQQRNNIVHHGTRTVENAWQLIASVRKMCQILHEYSIPEG